eukprot:Tbor_TRINITY_DN5211_c0_g1::TRINITY_DN5211_c0_g1_i1::g.16204::m.16204/K09522/DNAJC2; DnaJ homolog subfamily C member 2
MDLELPIFCNGDDVKLNTPIGLSIINSREVESMGFWYHFSKAIKNDSMNTLSSQPSSPTNKKEGQESKNRTGQPKKFVKLTEDDLQIDWYDVLELEHGDTSSENDIRVAYKKRCLETHPDKQSDHSDVLFKKVQRAFEILGDHEARRAFDSSRPFDSSIPSEFTDLKGDDSQFYTIFEPVFERNRKFSTDPHIPSLGSDDLPVKKVREIYDSWLRFSSWRDFSHEMTKELETINESMSRDEKRYYQKENQRLLDKAKKNESKRIRTLVDRAIKLDPRLRRAREAEINAKEKEKADRELEKNRIRMAAYEKKAAAAAEEKAKEEAKKSAILDTKRVTKELLADIKDFFEERGALDSVRTNLLLPTKVRIPNINWLFNKITNPEEAINIANDIKSSSTALVGQDDKAYIPAVALFNDYVTDRELICGINRYGEHIKRKDAAELEVERLKKDAARKEEAAKHMVVSTTEWTEEDLENLQKAIAKYPGGTIDRWRKMAQMLHDKFVEEEVLAKTKELEAAAKKGGNAIASAAAQQAGFISSVTPSATGSGISEVEDWTPDQQKDLEAALRELKDYKDKDKFTKVATKVEGKSGKQCFDRYKHLVALNKK